MSLALDYHTAKALLEWQVELGVTEAICETPVNRYEVAERPAPAIRRAEAAAPAPAEAPAEIDPVALAEVAARSASDLDGLAAAMAAYDLCDLKRGARNLVFSDGVPGAAVMVIGEAPGRDEDMQAKPFVGRAGQLLDRMLGAISHARAPQDGHAPVYITNVLPWRPPQNRDPSPEEIAMMLPFLRRHVELAAPRLIVLMGNIACQAVLGRKGITRMRGEWTEAFGTPVLPMFHPAYLLRNPERKREAWADLLALQARLRDGA
ncbi:uracil-DNA glycosylase [Anianabacter salinae]|uniref:uracil-DNA glycosylase n=1 Tax=Anianabacter salinae TaxID=2851023 RepID=UPI00225E2038|nr:uracil-DNA glycosylase [Anianabacter salinae]MBV0910842.1 uracil-DNA glycosylase [Anianabacter salinae]